MIENNPANDRAQIVLVDGEKYCPECKVKKSVLCFSKCSGSPGGLQSYCKECKRKIGKKYKEKNEARESIAVPDTKTCPKCKTEKHSSKFCKVNGKTDGLNGWCKECSTKSGKKYKEKNKARETIVIPEFKTCSKCRKGKTYLEFDKSSENKDGLKDYCKKCRATSNRKRLYGASPD